MPRRVLRARRALSGLALGLGLVLPLPLLAACTPVPAATPAPTAPDPSGDGVLRIGTLFSTRGPGTSAAAELAGVHAAVRAIAAAGGFGGVPIEVVSRDGGTAGDGAAEAAFAELVERGVDVVIGPSSMDIAALLLEPARQAGVPLLTTSARTARPEGSEDVLFRFVATMADQGAGIGDEVAAAGAARVVLIRSDDAGAQDLAGGLADALAAHDAELTQLVAGADSAADAGQAAGADAVVVATADADDPTAALLSALLADGAAPTSIWLTAGAVGRYELPQGALTGAHGVLAGSTTDAGVIAAIRQEDPGAGFRYGPESYDATVLVALAAELAGDDGGPSLAAFLPAAAADGIECRSYGECLAVLAERPDVRYQGASGDLALDAAHDRANLELQRLTYDETGRPVAALP